MANGEDRLLEAFPRRTYEDWRKEVERGLSGADFEQRLVTRTLEGIAVQPLYTERDFDAAADAAGFAGAPPYLRGPVAAGRYGESWDMRPRYDNPDPRRLGEEIAADLGRGARSLWLCFDGDVRAGRSSTETPRAAFERGVPCANAAELAQLLAPVPLPEVALSLDAGANAFAVAACLFQVARSRGVALPQLDAWLNADPLGALASDGALPCSLEAARRQAMALAAFCAQRAPRVRSTTVSIVPHHEAGAHAVQELAYALATGVTYLRWLTEGGLTLAEACSQLSFRLAVGADFFMEIAKLRAMRRCWSSLVRECGGSAQEQRCTIHATTSTRTKTTRDPWVNLLRETSEAFSAAAGGADAITTQGFDRLLGVSGAFARRIAGNAQVILNEEAHVARVADPAGGAYYVEALSEQLAQQAWRLFQAIETSGGMEAALQSGQVAAEIAESARARGALIAERKLAITGVSEFAKVDEDRVARAQPERDAASARRTAAATPADEAVLRPLRAAAERSTGSPELVALAIDAAGRGASLEQLIAAVVGTGIGTGAAAPARIAALPLRRHAEPFERLRDACDERERTSGRRPSVFLCNLGPISEHQARAQFASGFFAAGGFGALGNDGFAAPEAAGEAFAASGARLAAICGSDASYPQWVERLAPLLRARGALRVIVAGRAGEREASYRAAGVSDFIFAGCDAVATLEALLAAQGAGS